MLGASWRKGLTLKTCGAPRASSPLATAGLVNVPILRKATAATTCLAATSVGYYPDRTKVGWWKNGYPEYFAKVLNATNWTRTDIVVNGQALDLNVAKSIEGFKRILDMRRGLLQRTCTVELQDGAKIKLETERFISMASPNRAAVEIRVTPVHGVNTLEFQPTLDGDVSNEDTNWDDSFWRHEGHESDPGAGTSVLWNTTEKTAFTVACAQAVGLEGATWTDKEAAKATGLCASFASPQAQLVLRKHVGLVSSLHAPPSECPAKAQNEARDGRELGYLEERARHEAAWSDIWSLGDIRICLLYTSPSPRDPE